MTAPTRPDAAAEPALLKVHVHDKRYGARRVLHALRLELAVGEIVSLVGASGCGKSSLLRIIAGLDPDYAGSVCLAGRPLRAPAREIGFIFQEPRLFPWCSVADNIAFEAGPPQRGDARVAALLADVGLPGYAGALPKQLSGGQAQRVALARGLFGRPRVLLLDEPFSAVDAFTRMKLQDLLATLARRHAIAVLLVTHDIDEAVYLGDRVRVLEAAPGPGCDDIVVDLARPRAREAPALVTCRGQVLQALRAAHVL